MVLIQKSSASLQPNSPDYAARSHLERERVLAKGITRIRHSLELNSIFETTTEELRDILACDRTIVYQFKPDWSGEIVAESVASNWDSLQSRQISEAEIQADVTQQTGCAMQSFKGGESSLVVVDTYLQENRGGIYSKGLPYRVVNDVTRAGFTDCYLAFLAQLFAKAYIIVPLFVQNQLWGLLCAYQNDAPRHWTVQDINMVLQVGEHVAVAIQQAQLLRQTQTQAETLQKTLEQLQATQSQLIQSEKMSSLGQLVAGIAHEINNPINFIFGNLTYLADYQQKFLELVEAYQSHYPNPPEVIQDILADEEIDFIVEDSISVMKSMHTGTERVKKIVQSLRIFSRLDEAEYKAADIHAGLDSTLLLLQHRLEAPINNQPIQIIKDYGALPEIDCFPGQLNQVFMNILTNAIDALEAIASPQEPSIIRIQTIFIEDQRQIKIIIANNGPLIPAEIQNQIFDPFFTTKPVGQGTGLGMSISYQVITEKHGGQIQCLSEPGQNTQFVITLPTCQQQAIAT